MKTTNVKELMLMRDEELAIKAALLANGEIAIGVIGIETAMRLEKIALNDSDPFNLSAFRYINALIDAVGVNVRYVLACEDGKIGNGTFNDIAHTDLAALISASPRNRTIAFIVAMTEANNS